MKKQNAISNNRKGIDIIGKFIKVIGLSVWGFMLLIIVIIERARPQQSTILDRMYGASVRGYWDDTYVAVAMYFSIGLFIISGIALMLNLLRLRRKEDKVNKSVLISFIVSFLLIVYTLLRLFVL